jgi:hypothetical protein
MMAVLRLMVILTMRKPSGLVGFNEKFIWDMDGVERT